MSTQVIDNQQFTAADRCDRCGAQAHVRATLPKGELLFCSHHARAHQEKLSNVAVKIDNDANFFTA